MFAIDENVKTFMYFHYTSTYHGEHGDAAVLQLGCLYVYDVYID
jgi:hypothetical protein